MKGKAANKWYIIKQESGWNFIPLGSWGQCRITANYPTQDGYPRKLGYFHSNFCQSLVKSWLVPRNVKIPAHSTFPQPLSKMQVQSARTHQGYRPKVNGLDAGNICLREDDLEIYLKVKINRNGLC